MAKEGGVLGTSGGNGVREKREDEEGSFNNPDQKRGHLLSKERECW